MSCCDIRGERERERERGREEREVWDVMRTKINTYTNVNQCENVESKDWGNLAKRAPNKQHYSLIAKFFSPPLSVTVAWAAAAGWMGHCLSSTKTLTCTDISCFQLFCWYTCTTWITHILLWFLLPSCVCLLIDWMLLIAIDWTSISIPYTNCLLPPPDAFTIVGCSKKGVFTSSAPLAYSDGVADVFAARRIVLEITFYRNYHEHVEEWADNNNQICSLHHHWDFSNATDLAKAWQRCFQTAVIHLHLQGYPGRTPQAALKLLSVRSLGAEAALVLTIHHTHRTQPGHMPSYSGVPKTPQATTGDDQSPVPPTTPPKKLLWLGWLGYRKYMFFQHSGITRKNRTINEKQKQKIKLLLF